MKDMRVDLNKNKKIIGEQLSYIEDTILAFAWRD
jgi:hypothetical protein